jgi:hypothetical protein
MHFANPRAAVTPPAGRLRFPRFFATVVVACAGCTTNPTPQVADTLQDADDLSMVDVAKVDVAYPTAECGSVGQGDVGLAVDVTAADEFAADSAQCVAPGIAACRLDVNCGWKRYFCYGPDGQFVGVYANIGGSTPVPCAPAQMLTFLAAYGQPCWKQVPYDALPTIAVALDMSKLPTTFCSNISGQRLVFNIGAVTYTLEKQNYCDEGSNQHPLEWKLSSSPSYGSALRTDLPFLHCNNYIAKSSTVASQYPWHLTVTNSCEGTTILLRQNAAVDLDKVFSALAASFVSCDKEGAAP